MKAFLLTLLCFTAACTAHNEVTPEFERNVSESTISWLYNQYGVFNDRDTSRMLHRVTERLASAIPSARANARPSTNTLTEAPDWQVFVLNTQEKNAFSVGDGVIFITGGLLEVCETESTLAAIVAHEMSHQLLGHLSRELSKVQATNQPIIAFSGSDEIEADRFALHILRSAHYDPRAAITAVAISNRLDEETISPDAAEFFSTRRQALQTSLAALPTTLGATDSTREFSKIKMNLSRARLAHP